MHLKYQPSSEPLHTSANWLFLNRVRHDRLVVFESLRGDPLVQPEMTSVIRKVEGVGDNTTATLKLKEWPCEITPFFPMTGMTIL